MTTATSLAPATATLPSSAPLGTSTLDATTSRVAVASTSSLPASTSHVPATGGPVAAAAPSSAAAGCRLLWRGRLITPSPHNKPLFGIAIIAHLFSFPSSGTSALPLLSPNQVTAQASPFDDPFAAPGSSSSGADMCLGLEMTRGGDLKVLGEVWVASSAEAQEQKRGKGKGKERETVQVETPTEVRVYVDPRCPETVGWFEDWFCREGSAGRGVRVDVGGEEVIIFANLPSSPPPTSAPSSAQGSTSTASPRPALTLLLGRAMKRPTRAPRPDDPLPRENLFATKLRRTNSLPVLGFGAPPPPPKLGLARGSRAGSSLGAIAESSASSSTNLPPTAGAVKPARKLKRGSSSRTLMSLMGDEATRKSTTLPRRSSSSAASLPPPPPPLASSTTTAPPLKKRTLSRTTSSRELLAPSHAASANSSSSSSRRPSAPPPPSHPSSDSSNRRGFLKRSRSALLESPVSSDAEEERHRGHSRVPGSPTPSLATTFGGWDDEEEQELYDGAAEGLDGLVELKPLFSGVGGQRKGTLSKRSTSAPVGVFELDSGPLKDVAERRRREATEAPPEVGGRRERQRREQSVGAGLPIAGGVRGSREQSMGAVGGHRGEREQSVVVETVEGRNKGTIRKIILARLTLRNLTRDDEQFRDVFSMCSKGVQFALRDTYKIKPIDRVLATKFADQHIEMYLSTPPPPAAMATDTSAQALPAPSNLSRPPPSSSTAQEKRSPPTPAPTPAPEVPTITVKQEEGAEPTLAPETVEAPPSLAMQVDVPPVFDVVKKVMAAEEGLLPSPRSLEAREEEVEESAERGAEIRLEGEPAGEQE
ncbi:hypothetical protein BCR35DRAFT_307503 [Leucosporidium creatinivorum]|uniref:Sld7 C-terminal domain-containing protein n=1 Tax=Leucosporidium creatinivorum TaxID=106004 RepID=A0A1Y2EMI5_9BASI|nr:hypothetical protein BCR35DRAFT_307503 [Leucosporidium creatinivorum]